MCASFAFVVRATGSPRGSPIGSVGPDDKGAAMTSTPPLAGVALPGAPADPGREASLAAVAGVAIVALLGTGATLVLPLVGLPLALLGFIGSLVLVRRASGLRMVVLMVTGVLSGLAVVLAAVVLLFLTPVRVTSEVGTVEVDSVEPAQVDPAP